MKKALSVLLVLVLVLTCFVGCGKKKGIKVGIINNDPSESGYRKANVEDLEKVFSEENGYQVTKYYSLVNDDQIAQAKQMIQSGIKYLLLSAAATTGWDSVLQEAKDAGVKVILFDRTIDADASLYEASVVSDMAKEGETAVAWLAKQGLSEYKVIHIQGTMGSAAQVGRSGALQTKVDAESTWSIVKQQTGNWSADEARQIVQSVIDAGQDFNVIYAENDNMAQGAVAALDQAGIEHGVGKKVIVMGFDCNTFALEELKKGTWNYDGQCNPFQSSYLVDIINKLEKGEAINPKTIIMEEKGFDATTITDDDVKNYGI